MGISIPPSPSYEYNMDYRYDVAYSNLVLQPSYKIGGTETPGGEKSTTTPSGKMYVLTRPILSQLWSFKIRRTTFLNYIKFANLLILRLSKLGKGRSGCSILSSKVVMFDSISSCLSWTNHVHLAKSSSPKAKAVKNLSPPNHQQSTLLACLRKNMVSISDKFSDSRNWEPEQQQINGINGHPIFHTFPLLKLQRLLLASSKSSPSSWASNW